VADPSDAVAPWHLVAPPNRHAQVLVDPGVDDGAGELRRAAAPIGASEDTDLPHPRSLRSKRRYEATEEATTAETYSTRNPEIARAMTSRWISDAPSKIV
jgi:hypothetical protein